MTRDHEPYDDEEFGPQVGDAQRSLLQLMLFPLLGADALDSIIRKCWHGDCKQIRDLVEECKILSGCSIRRRATPLDSEIFNQTQEECRQLVASGFLEKK